MRGTKERHSMRRDEPAYSMKNGTDFPARPANVLLDVVTLRKIFSAMIGLWIYTRDSNNGFRLREFVERPGTGKLELTFSKGREVEVDFSSHASSPSTRERFLEAVYSNQSPRWRSV